MWRSLKSSRNLWMILLLLRQKWLVQSVSMKIIVKFWNKGSSLKFSSVSTAWMSYYRFVQHYLNLMILMGWIWVSLLRNSAVWGEMIEIEEFGSRQFATYCRKMVCWRTNLLGSSFWHYQLSFPTAQCFNSWLIGHPLEYREFLCGSNRHNLQSSPFYPFLRQFHILRTGSVQSSSSGATSYEMNDHSLNQRFIASILS